MWVEEPPSECALFSPPPLRALNPLLPAPPPPPPLFFLSLLSLPSLQVVPGAVWVAGATLRVLDLGGNALRIFPPAVTSLINLQVGGEMDLCMRQTRMRVFLLLFFCLATRIQAPQPNYASVLR